MIFDPTGANGENGGKASGKNLRVLCELLFKIPIRARSESIAIRPGPRDMGVGRFRADQWVA
jgi:hypothetical protein